jgi:hypothetical protein
LCLKLLSRSFSPAVVSTATVSTATVSTTTAVVSAGFFSRSFSFLQDTTVKTATTAKLKILFHP